MSRSFIQYRLLSELAKTPGASQRRLARRLGHSLGKTNYCLRELKHSGLVCANGISGGYVVTEPGLVELRRLALRCLEEKRRECEELQRVVEELSVGNEA